VIRAVVVEDEPLARQYLCTLLKETGKVEVVGEADDGRAGLRLCAERAPDAAFLDICIPGPDRLSLAGRLLTLAKPRWSSS
jgi:DNA-binding NarL/FixJ family response regulator